MYDREGLTVAEALDNLTILADAESLEEIEITQDAHLISHSGEKLREITWIHAGGDDQTVAAIKETFHAVHEYLEKYYAYLSQAGDIKRLVEGVNTIMSLVGEAAKNLDRYSALFEKKITEYKEYTELLNFYRDKITKESFQTFAKTPLPKELFESAEGGEGFEEEEVEEVTGVHILNDVEVVKRDGLYELFLMKNEAGHHFYTYDLARNIKLACNFGEFSEKYFGDDPLLQIKNWEDRELHLLSKVLLDHSRKPISKFYNEAMKYKENELMMSLHNTVMALMMAANPRNMIRQFSPKGCCRYFGDFQLFLREVLQSRDYQRLLIYGPPSAQPIYRHMLELIDSLCLVFYLHSRDKKELKAMLKNSIGGAPKQLSEFLQYSYHALSETLKHHPNGPIFKVLDFIMEGGEEERAFDPLMQANLPEIEGGLEAKGREVSIVRMAYPTKQEFIQHAEIEEEFIAFLRAYRMHNGGRLLFINYQDRTSWKEHARCVVLEELARRAEFAETLTVVTLSKDTEFYHQSGIYEKLNDAKEFIHQFADHLSDESGGYYFPSELKKDLSPDYMKKLLACVHQVFFESKRRLSHPERLDFIEIIYHLIELKLIELVSPTLLTLSSKDGLDIGGTATAGLLALLGIAAKKKWSQEEMEELRLIVMGQTLMVRERAVHADRFERMVQMIHRLEENPRFAEEFKALFAKETFQFQPQFPPRKQG